jgi:hypothetical protein
VRKREKEREREREGERREDISMYAVYAYVYNVFGMAV